MQRNRPAVDERTVDPLLAATEALQLALGQIREAQGYVGDQTLGDLRDARLAVGSKEFSASTLRGYKSDLGSVVDLVGDRPLADLSQADLECAIDKLPAGRWNAVTRCWRAALRWAHKHGFPGATVLLPDLRAHKARRIYYREDVWERAVEALVEGYREASKRSRSPAGAALTSVLWGVRRGGAARLRWDGVDFDRGTVVVIDKAQQVREIEMGPVARPLLASQPRRSPWVWPARRDSTQGHVCPNTVGRHARRVFDAHGLEGLTLHQAGRHAAACAALARGASIPEVSGHLGHVDNRMVTERYTGPASAAGARAVLDGAMGARALLKVVGS